MELAVNLYAESSKLSRDERFGLRAQMRRSAVSIPSNIAEGWGRRSRREFARFLKIALGSTYELQTQIEIADRLDVDGDWHQMASKANELGRILHGLLSSLITDH